mmetsp:Transcript_36187/g.144637  ORF Transcript_36187/g.144637 Transcript_36187/m.144637 type:complete len:254 (+) Transcript_36187:254-1015(+)
MEKRMLSDPRNEDNPRVAFLFKKDDKPYLLYRKLVGPLDEGDEEPEEPNKVSSSTVTKAEVATPLNSAREVPVDVPSATAHRKRRFTEDGEANKPDNLVYKEPERSYFDEDNDSTAAPEGAKAENSQGGYARHIPKEVLNEFLAKSKGEPLPKAKEQGIEKSNVGHKLLSKMGWKEGSGLGKDGVGSADAAKTFVKTDKSGIGADTGDTTEVKPEDDIYEQYRKRMMLAYRYRPNPMNNPRKGYDGYDSGQKR